MIKRPKCVQVAGSGTGITLPPNSNLFILQRKKVEVGVCALFPWN